MRPGHFIFARQKPSSGIFAIHNIFAPFVSSLFAGVLRIGRQKHRIFSPPVIADDSQREWYGKSLVTPSRALVISIVKVQR
ncbi:hypothetical protein SAMN05216299_10367 [Nitrosospira sp. Nsp14]|nr:hypothetical protein SAMN05216299_10367 [Nitrosospira sp. Nsp14]